MNKIHVDPIVIVEGKYDKITLENIIDATILVCNGFEIFKNKEETRALKRMAKGRGAIILTDSDRAGGIIRSYLQTILQNETVYTLYVPPIPGKERRKKEASKEGLLGVEGMDSELLRSLFEEFRAAPVEMLISSVDLYEAGLMGAPNSSERKSCLLKALSLPPRLSNNALLKEINRRFTPSEFHEYVLNLLK